MSVSAENEPCSSRFHITDPELIPAERYFDAEFYEMECERMWPHVWQMACRLEEIPEVGDWVEYEILEYSVIVVNTKAGVRAFHNACRHRGVKLVDGGSRGNCRAAGFNCPFHGWRWNMDGDNTFVFGAHIFSPEKLERPDIDLVSCRTESWGGFVFINFDDDAPSLEQCLGPVAERLAIRNVDELKAEWWYGTVLPTNWKLAMEAFMEGYHVMRTHPQLHVLSERSRFAPGAPVLDKTPKERVQMMVEFLERLSSGMAGLVHGSEARIARNVAETMELPDDPDSAIVAFLASVKDEIHRDGVERGLPVPDLGAIDTADPHRGVEFIFPHFFLLPFFGAMSSYRIRPLGPETCLFEIWSLAFLPDDEQRERPDGPTMLPYDSEDFPEIPKQDYSNLPRQQLGLHAQGFDFMRLSRDFEGLISNYQRLIDGYIGGVDPGKLAKAQQLVNDGYDHAIVDLHL
jgi:phenylpropionate dioxygenase-like ring-hydroxylating dioxygenase large terminal subunit